MTDLAHKSQILRRVPDSNPAIVFFKSHVQHPVQGVFHSPMSAHGLSGALGIRLQTRQVVAQFDCYLAIDTPNGLDQDQASQVAPETKTDQPGGRGNAPTTPRFAATVASLDRFTKADGRLGNSPLF